MAEGPRFLFLIIFLRSLGVPYTNTKVPPGCADHCSLRSQCDWPLCTESALSTFDPPMTATVSGLPPWRCAISPRARSVASLGGFTSSSILDHLFEIKTNRLVLRTSFVPGSHNYIALLNALGPILHCLTQMSLFGAKPGLGSLAEVWEQTSPNISVPKRLDW